LWKVIPGKIGFHGALGSAVVASGTDIGSEGKAPNVISSLARESNIAFFPLILFVFFIL
jgi:hypothetical protein